MQRIVRYVVGFVFSGIERPIVEGYRYNRKWRRYEINKLRVKNAAEAVTKLLEHAGPPGMTNVFC